MTEFSVIWGGLVSGALFGLLGLGYLLLLRATRIFNFAVGAFAGIAAVSFASWSSSMPPPVAALASIAGGTALAILVDIVVTRPIQAREIRGHLGVVLGLTATLFLIIQVTRQIFSARTFLGQPIVTGHAEIARTVISLHSALTLIVAIAATASITLWQAYGKGGRLLAAVGDNWEAAVLLALPVRGIRYIAVGVAGLICSIAGVLLAGGAPVTFQSSFNLALVGFLALVIGGTSSNWGPLLGGMIIGLTDTIGARLIGASIHEYLMLLVILLVFRLRPQGLLAKTVRD
jgi:branched-chain amino acid transport system permease protein